VALLAALERGEPLDGVAGLAIRGSDGVPVRTADRPLEDDLDRLPFARRYRAHTRHLGVPFIRSWRAEVLGQVQLLLHHDRAA